MNVLSVHGHKIPFVIDCNLHMVSKLFPWPSWSDTGSNPTYTFYIFYFELIFASLMGRLGSGKWSCIHIG